MRKVIAALNMTLDGICDHTAGIPDEDLHQHYAGILDNAGVLLYGRTTYQLMQFWQTLLKKPSGQKSMDDFALAIDKIPKIVFSHTLKNTEWNSARLATKEIEKEVLELKQQSESSKDILVGSRSLIIQLINLDLIDEFQICIYPMIEGKGLPLFDKIKGRTTFRLLKTKTFDSGAIVLYYKPTR
ncbi:dihydrofolate reductase family protein [Pontibacter sp. 172403-2]|uniref:dihydrofolate reductase family protein n=1 Tax=Pontibacter rufus TaxID=2791028 RepID=UPI0018AFBD39|nr:dihydrofolate reductase family protein [Pontibacter sp. 172403-2]MBF9255771.1 dihydrofolate reductase family protein [Pontibacter sp. 172403-2]